MCGFFQVFSRGRKVDRGRFDDALRSMKHRGPDATGVHHHPEPMTDHGGNPVHVSSGHQRLSILDLDPRSNQPFLHGRQSLVFNGEIYNFRELRGGLPASLGELRTTGDTEVLLHGLRWKNSAFLQDANGMWAFSYLDEGERAVVAARDCHGKKPLFFFSDESHLILSSTALAIHRYLGIKPRLEPDFADRYLVHGSAFPGSGDQTHWKDIRQVPAGHLLRFDIASWKLNIERYFDLREAALVRLRRTATWRSFSGTLSGRGWCQTARWDYCSPAGWTAR